jgi:nucleotide-binding universal stress UspA family protein
MYTAMTVTPPIPPHVSRFLDAAVVQAYHEEQAEAVFKPVREFARQQGWQLSERSVPGHAGEAIAQAAEAGKYDLLVMGTHGHGAFGGLVLGSVASRVLARCTVPLLLIR